MVSGSKDRSKKKDGTEGKEKKKGRVKVLNLNKETVKELTVEERKRVVGATMGATRMTPGGGGGDYNPPPPLSGHRGCPY